MSYSWRGVDEGQEKEMNITVCRCQPPVTDHALSNVCYVPSTAIALNIYTNMCSTTFQGGGEKEGHELNAMRQDLSSEA